MFFDVVVVLKVDVVYRVLTVVVMCNRAVPGAASPQS